MFTIIPAIDLKGGFCVRLKQGRADETKVYSEDPVTMAKRWFDEGAKYLHVVDLDGAFQGKPVHFDVIARIVKSIPIPVEVGGGLRTDEDMKAMLDCGVRRVIIGTRAVREPGDLKRLAVKLGAGVAVGIDAKKGFVQVSGWVEVTRMKAVDLAKKIDEAGIKTIIYTDTEKDGMMSGINAGAMDELAAAVKCEVIASGGVTSLSDVSKLLKLKRANLGGVIVGKALYEGAVQLGDLNKLVSKGI